MYQTRVTKIRRLLAEASEPAIPHIVIQKAPIGGTHRKDLIQQARVTAARYSLQAQLDSFIYAAGCEAITGLDLAQLQQLVARLVCLGINVETACDPPGVPPAR